MAGEEDDQHLRYRALSRVYHIVKPPSELSSDGKKTTSSGVSIESFTKALTKMIAENGLDVDYSIPRDAAVARHSPNLIGSTVLHFAQYVPRLVVDANEGISKICCTSINLIFQNVDSSTSLHQIVEQIAELKESVSDALFWWKRNIVDLLYQHLERDVRCNPSDKWGMSHFHIACMVNASKVVDFFLNSGFVDVDVFTGENSPLFPRHTALHIAVHFSHVESIRVLLSHRSRIRLLDASRRTPLELSILLHRKIIRSWCADPATCERSREVVLILTRAHLEECADHTLYQLQLACMKGFENSTNDSSKHAMSDRCGVTLGYSGLHFAAQFNEEVLKIFLMKHANIVSADVHGIRPLDICIMKYGTQIFDVLSRPLKKLVHFKDDRAWDVLLNLHNDVELKNYLSTVGENIAEWRVSSNSAIWQGFTLLHVAVILAKEGRISLEHNDSKEIDLIESKWRNSNNDDPPWLKSVQILMTNGADFTVQDDNGMSPLHLAFHLGKISVIKSMLTLGTFVANPVDGTGLSHFHIACLQGDLDSVKAYVSNGISVSDPIKCDYKFDTGVGNEKLTYRKGSTPLHIAVVQKQKNMIGLLLAHGSDVFAQNEDGLTPIHLAFHAHKESFLKDTQDVVNLLFSVHDARCKNSIITNSEPSHFHIACASSDCNVVKDLLQNDPSCHDFVSDSKKNKSLNLERQADHSFANCSPLQIAILFNNWKVVDVLVSHGADSGLFTTFPNGTSCLHRALMQITREYESVHSFLNSINLNWSDMEPIDDFGLTSLHIAAALNRPDYIQKLTMSAADANAKINAYSSVWPGYTALHMAIEYYKPEKPDNFANTIKILLQRGADGTILNSKNESALHMAFKKGLGAIASLIFAARSCVFDNATNNSGLTHFHVACSRNFPKVVTTFLKSEVDVNQPTDFFADIRVADGKETVIVGGSTPLHIAIQYHVEEVVDVLLRNGADANARDSRGWTPLHVACDNTSNRNIVEKLLSVGRADPNVTSVMNETAFHVLMRSGQMMSNLQLIEVLLNHATSVNTESFEEDYASSFECAVKRMDFVTLKMVIQKGTHLEKKVGKNRYNAIHLLVMDNGQPNNSSRQTFSKSRFSRYEYYEMIDLLIEEGCDIDHQTVDGSTPLYLAVKSRNVEGVVALLKSGADVNVVDSTCGPRSSLPEAYMWSRRQFNDGALTVLLNQVKNLQALGFHVASIVWANYMAIKKARSSLFFGISESISQALVDEIRKMKKISIGRGWSLYDMISRQEHETAFIVHSKVLKDVVAQLNVFTEYPELGGILKFQIRRSKLWKELLEVIVELLGDLIGVHLPVPCWESIMKNLSTKDLRNFTNSKLCSSVRRSHHQMGNQWNHYRSPEGSRNLIRSPNVLFGVSSTR